MNVESEDATQFFRHAPAEVVRHFLKVEATRPKFSHRKNELLSWCELPEPEVMVNGRRFAEEREDVNPALVYTVGTPKDDRSSQVAFWSREWIQCRDIFAWSISPRMQSDIDRVRGNILAFALGPAKAYSEFRPLSSLSDLSSIVILVAHGGRDRDGKYEVVDGAHRLVALCRAEVKEVEAYVAHMR
jgi:hypothetical protein